MVSLEQLPCDITIEAAEGCTPSYASEGAAGADLVVHSDYEIVLAPGEKILLSSGVKLAIPPGFEMQIRPRSGLSLKTGLRLPNSPGTIDSDYRGTVYILIENCGTQWETIVPRQRIAQGVVTLVSRANFKEQGTLQRSQRGARGFGSTGI